MSEHGLMAGVMGRRNGPLLVFIALAGALSCSSDFATEPTLTPGAPAQLVVTTEPDGAVSGATFTTRPVVDLRDAQGNLTGSTAAVTASVASGDGSLLGSRVVAAVAGVATFTDLRIDLAAEHVLEFTIAGPITVTSSPFVVSPGAASQLAITTEAEGAGGGLPFTTQPVVEVQDVAGNRATASTAGVTMTVSAGATPVGTTAVNAVAGIAAFTSTGVTGPGSLYTLTFSAPGLLAATQKVLLAVPTTFVAGSDHTCGLTSAGAAYCWGWNKDGQLGDGTTTHRNTPTLVSGGLTFTTLAAGYNHTCGVTSGGAAFCWGEDLSGKLGNGTWTDRTTPGPEVSGGLTFSTVTAGYDHTCGLTSTGAAFCWGQNYFGALGDGYGGWGKRESTPTAVSGSLTFTTLAAGPFHTCGVTSAGAGYCWGDGHGGMLGNGTRGSRDTPTLVAGDLKFAMLAPGRDYTCGLTSAGAAYCWGSEPVTGNERLTPRAVGGFLTFTTLAAGWHHTCGLTSNAVAYCWGRNGSGQFGDGTTTSRATPTAVSGGLTFATIRAGWNYTCGLTNEAVAYCWGYNEFGQVGDGTTTHRHTPTAVSGGLTIKIP